MWETCLDVQGNEANEVKAIFNFRKKQNVEESKRNHLIRVSSALIMQSLNTDYEKKACAIFILSREAGYERPLDLC